MAAFASGDAEGMGETAGFGATATTEVGVGTGGALEQATPRTTVRARASFRRCKV